MSQVVLVFGLVFEREHAVRYTSSVRGSAGKTRGSLILSLPLLRRCKLPKHRSDGSARSFSSYESCPQILRRGFSDARPGGKLDPSLSDFFVKLRDFAARSEYRKKFRIARLSPA